MRLLQREVATGTKLIGQLTNLIKSTTPAFQKCKLGHINCKVDHDRYSFRANAPKIKKPQTKSTEHAQRKKVEKRKMVKVKMENVSDNPKMNTKALWKKINLPSQVQLGRIPSAR